MLSDPESENVVNVAMGPGHVKERSCATLNANVVFSVTRTVKEHFCLSQNVINILWPAQNVKNITVWPRMRKALLCDSECEGTMLYNPER